MTTSKQEIERLVSEYPGSDKDLYRLKLKHLVLIAEREQLVSDYEGKVK